MKKLELNELRDKMLGCWTGKNIGGVLGAPFELKRQINTNDYYVQDLTQGPPANDDLDLQIVSLAAAERYGRRLTASVLGEYWLSYVIPNWAEYGMGKANLREGFEPPLSGYLGNPYRNSNGCWIRSEIWACLAPGHPEIAVLYAHEDAAVDHAEEGLYAEIFTAALESAAFAEDDPEKLIEIALSYIPEDCSVTKAVRTAQECFRQKVPFAESRRKIHNAAPGTFGIQNLRIPEFPAKDNEGMETGAPGFDAPENIGFVVAAWLYGENDFGRSLVLANAYGEDTDCTCGTLGAVLGIILGASGIPRKWSAPLNDKISTMCIDRTSGGVWIPDTATELTGRILRDIPLFLGQQYCDILDPSGLSVQCLAGEDLYCARTGDYLKDLNVQEPDDPSGRELCAMSPLAVRKDFPAFSIRVEAGDSVYFHAGETKKLRVTVRNHSAMREKQWVKISLYLPADVSTEGADSVELPLNTLAGSRAEAEFTLQTDLFAGSRLEGVVMAELAGRHSYGCVRFLLLAH